MSFQVSFELSEPDLQKIYDAMLGKAEWLENKRQQLHSRMRRRRKVRNQVKRVKSPFSMI